MSNSEMAPNQKKGLSNWVWVGIGCAVLLFVTLVVVGVGAWWAVSKAKDVAADFDANPGLAAARLIVKASPELEEVAVDKDAGTMTVRNTTTGEEITVDLQDIQEGKINFRSGDKEYRLEASGDGEATTINVTGDEGTMRFSTGDHVAGQRPAWAPLYPGCEPEGEYAQTLDNGFSGAVRCTSRDGLDAVVAYYRELLEADGFAVQVNTLSGDSGQVAMLSADDEASGRTVVVNATTEAETAVIALTYNQRAQPNQ